MKNVFRLFYYLNIFATAEGICIGLLVFRLKHSSVFYASFIYCEPSSELIIFHRIVPAHCFWMDSDAIMVGKNAQRYFLQNTYFCSQSTKFAFIPGEE